MTATPPRSVLVTLGDVMLFANEAFRNMDVELGLGDIEDIRVAMQSAFDRLAAASVPAGFVLVPRDALERIAKCKIFATMHPDKGPVIAWDFDVHDFARHLLAAPIPTPSQADGAGEVERLREALKDRDAKASVCPYMKPSKPNPVFSCKVCGADSGEPCRRRVIANADFVFAVRAALHPSTAGQEEGSRG